MSDIVILLSAIAGTCVVVAFSVTLIWRGRWHATPTYAHEHKWETVGQVIVDEPPPPQQPLQRWYRWERCLAILYKQCTECQERMVAYRMERALTFLRDGYTGSDLQTIVFERWTRYPIYDY